MIVEKGKEAKRENGQEDNRAINRFSIHSTIYSSSIGGWFHLP
jgi:hypothetical protein